MNDEYVSRAGGRYVGRYMGRYINMVAGGREKRVA